MADIYEAITKGLELPACCYRVGIDETSVDVLSRLGIMHLHIGSRNSNELLFLQQFEDHVVFLELSNHRHFETDPPGTLLKKLHEGKVAAINLQLEMESAALEAERRAASAEKNAEIRRRLGLRRHS